MLAFDAVWSAEVVNLLRKFSRSRWVDPISANRLLCCRTLFLGTRLGVTDVQCDVIV